MPSHFRRPRPCRHALTAVALTVLAWAAGPAAAATPAIYKCFDRNLAVLYTDQPCSGELLDVRPGSADPEAVAALARERDALSRSIERRIADQRRATPERGDGAPLPIRTRATTRATRDATSTTPRTWAAATATTSAPRARSDRERPSLPSDRNRYVPNPPRGLPR